MVNNEVIKVDFGSRHAKLHRLARHSPEYSVSYFAEGDHVTTPDKLPEAESSVEMVAGNIIAVLERKGYEANAQHLQAICLERVLRGDSLPDIYAMAMAYTHGVDNEIYEFFKHPPRAATRNDRQ